MPRRSPHLELSLLLAVAPLVAGCDEPEARRCVGPDGVYLQDACCETTAACHVPGSHHVYVPHRHYTGSGTLVGLALPVANVVRNSHALLDVAVWGVVACAVQLLAYLAARAAIPQLAKDIPAGKVAPALFLAAVSISVGLVNAACMEG